MRYLVFFYVILSTLTLGEDRKIYVEKHVNKPLYKFVNKYPQHIYCAVFDGNLVKDFYIPPKSKTEPKLFKPGFKWWCRIPKRSV